MSSGAKARASVIGATGIPVRGLVIVVQIRSSGIPRAFIIFTWLRWSWVGSNFGCRGLSSHSFANPSLYLE